MLLMIPVWQLALPLVVAQTTYPRDTAYAVSRLLRNFQDIIVVGGPADKALLYYLTRQQETVFYYPEVRPVAQELSSRSSPAIVVMEAQTAQRLFAEMARIWPGWVPLALLEEFEGREMDTYQLVRYQVYTLRYSAEASETN
jgi:hypothetical protein